MIIEISPYYKTHIQIDKFWVTAAATAATTATTATTAAAITVNYLPTTLL